MEAMFEVERLTRVQVGNLLLRPLIISFPLLQISERTREDSRSQSRIFGIRTISLTCYLGDVEGSQLIS
jgi:hypothetical protein